MPTTFTPTELDGYHVRRTDTELVTEFAITTGPPLQERARVTAAPMAFIHHATEREEAHVTFGLGVLSGAVDAELMGLYVAMLDEVHDLLIQEVVG